MEVKAFKLPDGCEFSENEKKAMQAIGDYFKSQFKEMEKESITQEQIGESVEKKLKECGFNGEKLEKIEAALKEQGIVLSAMKNQQNDGKAFKSIDEAMNDVFKSEDFKTAYADMRGGKSLSTGEFHLKLQTTDATDEDVTRTVASTRIYADAMPRNAFIALFSKFTVPQDKNRIMYNDASYTDGTGYVEEFAENKNVNKATLRGKYRELAKIGSVLPYSAETAEDFAYFLAWAKSQAQKGIDNKLDSLLWNGDGSDASNPTHIYGLKNCGVTAFDVTAAGISSSVSKPNVADLILAAKTQAKAKSEDAYMPNYAVMSYATEFKMRTLKNELGDYITVLPNGVLSVHGVQIIPSSKIGANELVLLDSETLQLHNKRDITMEIERVPATDSYNLWMWYRGQALVTRPDMKANVYVSDIETALAALAKA